METAMSDYKYVQPQQPEVLTPNQLYTREYAQGVFIPLLQNLAGGVGAFLFVFIPLWWLDVIPADAAMYGVLLGGLVFAVATMIRAFRDEVRYVIAAYGERQDKATRQALQAEVVQLREEMKRLRSQGVVSSQYVTLMSCERLLGDYFERHLDITRLAAMKRGYTRAQWDAAMRLCRTAQVVNEKGAVLVPTFAEAWAKVLHAQSAGMGSYDVTGFGDLVRKG
jgi:hypothetical protein